jgi:hypothetical protein
MIDKRPKPQCLGLRRSRRLCALEDIRDAQRQFSRLEWLGDIIVGTEFESGDAALGGVARAQNQDWYARGCADRLDEFKAAFARHHDVEYQQIEIEPGKACPRIGRGFRRCHAVPFALQIARQQAADAPVVIDDQEMGRVVGWGSERSGHRQFPTINNRQRRFKCVGSPDWRAR